MKKNDEMKTITFYSYKGGTGRSLAAANLAMALYRIGVSVCLLDFDLHSPGLHHKLAGQLGFEARHFSCGIAHLILRSLMDEGRITQDDLKSFGIDAGELPPALSQKQPKNIEPVLKRLKKSGSEETLYFIPAGQINSENYWRIAMHPEFESRVDLRRDADQSFFWRLLDSIKELEPQPEFLIVDSRSGVNELAGLSTRLLANANKVVVFTVNHPEGIEGSQVVIASLAKAYALKREDKSVLAPEEIYFVLSRIPDDREAAPGLYWPIAERVYGKNVEELGLNIHWLPQDDELAEKEELFIPAAGALKGRSLTERYLELFSKVVPEHAKRLLALTPKIQRRRLFGLVEKEGRLINPDDNTPNVAFRTVTYVRGLESSYNAMKQAALKQGMTEAEADIEADNALLRTGQDAAGGEEGFGEYASTLRQEKPGGRRLAISDAIRKWCEFDSKVGFGSFTATVLKGKKGQVQLTNNFLTSGRGKDVPNLCSFMTGYITSVLRSIYETEDVSVTHDRTEDCSQFTQSDPPVCRFNYTIQS